MTASTANSISTSADVSVPSTRTYSALALCLLWFGAAVSVAEMYTGGLLAPAGFPSGLWAIVAGHLAGVMLLALVGWIGFREDKPSMMCSRLSFGRMGSYLLSLANVLQLIGWTAVMVQQSGQALAGITHQVWGVGQVPLAIVVMGVLVALWSLWESKGRHWVNTLTVVVLFLLAAVMSVVLLQHSSLAAARPAAQPMSFWQAFDLSLLMPLSWVPLAADYARKAHNERIAAWAPALGYFAGSVWMYGIGFFAALLTGASDPTAMLLATGFGVLALLVVMLSAVTTTFLDVYSAVLSARNVVHGLPEKAGVLAVALAGVVLALWLNSELYLNFLAMIGSVFAPLSAILILDYCLLRVNYSQQPVNASGLCSLVAGIAVYWLATAYWADVSPLLVCLAATTLVHIGLRRLVRIFRPICQSPGR